MEQESAGFQKAQEYVARINSGEDRHEVIKDLPSIFVEAIDKELSVTDVKLKEAADIQKADKLRETLGISKVESSAETVASEYAKYSELANIQDGYRTLLDKLKNIDPNNENSWEAIQKTIYDAITYRSEFSKMKQEAGGDLGKILEQFRKESTEYRQLIEDLGSKASELGFKVSDNPGWTGINTRPDVKREGINTKVYATIPIGEHSYVSTVPELAVRLRDIAEKTDDVIQVKVPTVFMGHLSRNDSIVIHFKKPENAQLVQEALAGWMKDNGVSEEPREMDRTKVSVDSKETSFSDLVAENITKWLKENHGKYDYELLTKLGLDYAIRQSQVAPKIG